MTGLFLQVQQNAADESTDGENLCNNPKTWRLEFGSLAHAGCKSTSVGIGMQDYPLPLSNTNFERPTQYGEPSRYPPTSSINGGER